MHLINNEELYVEALIQIWTFFTPDFVSSSRHLRAVLSPLPALVAAALGLRGALRAGYWPGLEPASERLRPLHHRSPRSRR